MTTRVFIFIAAVCALTTSGHRMYGQSQEKLYSLMLLNFAKGIHWPAPTSDYFVVGVIEYPPLLPELVSTTSKTKIHGKAIKVVPISNLEELSQCQMVFLPAYKAKLLPKLLQQVSDHATLIVTNKSDTAKKGGGIDLVLREGKLTFDINCRSIEDRGMKISSGIRSIGNVVQ